MPGEDNKGFLGRSSAQKIQQHTQHTRSEQPWSEPAAPPCPAPSHRPPSISSQQTCCSSAGPELGAFLFPFSRTPDTSTQERVLMPKHSWGPVPASLGAPGLCSALLHQKARPGGWVGSKPNTSIARGLPREGQQGQPQDTESHPVPALEPGHPNQFSHQKR